MEATTPSVGAARAAAAPWQSYAAMIFGIVCISTSGIFIKLASVPGPVAGVYRVGVAVMVMAVPFLLRARHIQWTRRMLLAAGIGGIFFACDIALWNTALLSTSVANAVLLGNTAPIWVGLGAIVLFHQRLQRQFWWGLVLALAGAGLIVGLELSGSSGATLGNVLDRLETRGLVIRYASADDKRVKLLKISPSGRALVKRSQAAALRAQERILAPLQPKDRDTLMRLLSQLVELNNDASRAPQRLAG